MENGQVTEAAFPDTVDNDDDRLLPETQHQQPQFVMRAQRGWQSIDLGELWRARELLWFLAVRDIRVRYKQTVLGAIWIVLSPLMTAVIFTLIFGGLARIDANGIPYSLFALSGILIFNLFAHCLHSAVNSLVGNRNLIGKVYFPRLIYPIAPIATGVLDFLIGSLMLAILMLCYRIHLGWPILLAPVFPILSVLLGLGVGLWFGALNVRYRDVANLVGFLAQIWLYSSPIVYPLSLARHQWPRAYPLFLMNPMTGIAEGFRWALFNGLRPPLASILLSVGVIAGVLIGGLFFFRRLEREFVDIV